ncbi:MAG: ribosomal protein S18-alanine N-acetyltransferase [Lachnospiraceae bacterium]|nr:ribosomal protein S18-alanine N-acetyltransferase [Lachnospiraceae bacterium]
MITIREMTLADVDRVCVLEEMAFSMPWHKESFVEMIENKDALYLVADDEQSGVIGCCGVRSIVGEGDITNVVVHPDFRQKGVAYEMLTQLLLRGEQDFGIKEFTLEVRYSNIGAIHLYEKLGFVSEGIRKNFYEEPVEDALIMWKR